MLPKKTHRLLAGLLMLALAAGWLGSSIGLASAQSGELLNNPGFEDPYIQAGSADIFVATGWQAWYITPDGVTYPINCPENAPPDCVVYRIPVFRNTQPQDARQPPRARSGNSQKWGSGYATFIAGVYQQVSGITPGTRLRFSAFTQGFNCSNNLGCFGGVGEYGKSYEPGDVLTRVGIDPTGGTSPFGSGVVWSGYANPIDVFVQQQVEAVAQNATVTVFIWSSPLFPQQYNDIYVDDASLVAIGQGEAPATTAPTAQPANTLSPGATPPPAATVPPNTGTYTVQAGDTLSAIALQFNLTLDQLLALNPQITNPSLLEVGQVLNIGGTPQPTTPPTSTATPTLAPTAALTPTAISLLSTSTPAPVITETAALQSQGLCLSAFDDVDGSGTRDTGEGLTAGVQFDVKDAGGQSVAQARSDGVTEVNCISNLPDGRYTIDIAPPPDRIATTDTKWSVGLLAGTRVNVIFGSREPIETPTPAATDAAQAPTPEPQPAGRSSSAPLGLLVGGAFILIAVAAFAFVLSARRRR